MIDILIEHTGWLIIVAIAAYVEYRVNYKRPMAKRVR